MNCETKESVKSAYLSAGKKYKWLSQVFGEGLIDLFLVRPVWMPPSVRLNRLDSSSCTDELIPLGAWRGIGLAAYGRNREDSYLLINDLYWQPGGAHLGR